MMSGLAEIGPLCGWPESPTKSRRYRSGASPSTLPSMMARRFGICRMVVVSPAAAGVPLAGSRMMSRICRGLKRKPRCAWTMPWMASTAPVTIGDALDVPLKPA